MAPPGPGVHVEDLRGLWTRSLIVLPDGRRDTQTQVRWLQGESFFADLRQPPGRPDMTGAARVEDLTAEQVSWLATQEGFAGRLAEDADCIAWTRVMDYQPPSGIPDVARAWFEDDVLVEAGRDMPYVEYWNRYAEPSRAECWGARLLRSEDSASAWIVRAGGTFMLMRARPYALPSDRRLADLVREAASLREMRAMVDCEVSLGRISPEGWRIERSTLPFREGRVLHVLAADDGLDIEGRAWRIEAMEGDPAFT